MNFMRGAIKSFEEIKTVESLESRNRLTFHKQPWNIMRGAIKSFVTHLNLMVRMDSIHLLSNDMTDWTKWRKWLFIRIGSVKKRVSILIDLIVRYCDKYLQFDWKFLDISSRFLIFSIVFWNQFSHGVSPLSWV